MENVHIPIVESIFSGSYFFGGNIFWGGVLSTVFLGDSQYQASSSIWLVCTVFRFHILLSFFAAFERVASKTRQKAVFFFKIVLNLRVLSSRPNVYKYICVKRNNIPSMDTTVDGRNPAPVINWCRISSINSSSIFPSNF